MRRLLALAIATASPVALIGLPVGAAVLLSGCPTKVDAPEGPKVDTESPPNSPIKYKVLLDKTDNNQTEYHILVADDAKHDDVEALLKFVYRHLWQRNENEMAAVSSYVYNTEGAFKTPPRTPIAKGIRKLGDIGPVFENNVPLEFWQEIEEALKSDTERREQKPRWDEKLPLGRKVERDDPAKALTLTVPQAQPTLDGKNLEWVETVSFAQAMNAFTDTTIQIFENVPDLRTFTFIGTWKDHELTRITLNREDYAKLDLPGIGEKVGQHHGRAFLELATGRGSDKKVEKGISDRISKDYRSVLTQLKGKAKVDPTLK